MSALEVAILALAAWRAASMLVLEDGPWMIFRRLRGTFRAGQQDAGVIGQLLSCVWCTSVWTAALALMTWYTPLWPFVMVLAISAGAILIDRCTITGGDQ